MQRRVRAGRLAAAQQAPLARPSRLCCGHALPAALPATGSLGQWPARLCSLGSRPRCRPGTPTPHPTSRAAGPGAARAPAGRAAAAGAPQSPGCSRPAAAGPLRPAPRCTAWGQGGGGGRGVLAWDMGAGKGGSGPELLRAQPTLSVYAPAQRVGRGAGCSCGGGIRGATCQLPGPCMQALGLVAATPRWALAQQRWARVPPEGVRRAVPLQRQRQALVEAPRPKLRLQAVELVAARAGAPPCGAGSAAVAGARARATLRLPCLLGLPPALPPGLLLGCQVQRQQQRGLLGIVVTNKVLQGDAWSGAVL